MFVTGEMMLYYSNSVGGNANTGRVGANDRLARHFKINSIASVTFTSLSSLFRTSLLVKL